MYQCVRLSLDDLTITFSSIDEHTLWCRIGEVQDSEPLESQLITASMTKNQSTAAMRRELRKKRLDNLKLHELQKPKEDEDDIRDVEAMIIGKYIYMSNTLSPALFIISCRLLDYYSSL